MSQVKPKSETVSNGNAKPKPVRPKRGTPPDRSSREKTGDGTSSNVSAKTVLSDAPTTVVAPVVAPNVKKRTPKASVIGLVGGLRLKIAADPDSAAGLKMKALYGSTSDLTFATGVNNRHWQSAVHRMMLFRYVIVEASRCMLHSKEESVVSLRCIYGAGCDSNHENWLNTEARKCPGGRVMVSNPLAPRHLAPVRFDFRVVADATFAGDRARAGGSEIDGRKVGEEERQAVFYRMDVYGGDSGLDDRANAWRSAYSPEDAVRDGDHTTSGIGYIGCRVFRGYLGCDAGAEVDAHEAWWFRDAEGFVHFRPDEGAPFYPAHPTPDWLDTTKGWEGVVDGELRSLSVSQQKSFGPYTVYRIAVHPRNTFDHAVGKVFGSHALVESCQIKAGDIRDAYTSGYLSKFSEVLGKSAAWMADTVRESVATTQTVLYMPAVAAEYPTEKMRDLVGTSRLFIDKNVSRKCAEHPAMKICQSYNPEMYERIIHGTILRVMYHGRQAALDLHCGLQAQSARDTERMKGLTSGKAGQTPSGWASTFQKMVPAFAHYSLLRLADRVTNAPIANLLSGGIPRLSVLSAGDPSNQKVLTDPCTGKCRVEACTVEQRLNDCILGECGFDLFEDQALIEEAGGSMYAITVSDVREGRELSQEGASVKTIPVKASFPRFTNDAQVILKASQAEPLYGSVRWRWNSREIETGELIDLLSTYTVNDNPIYPLAMVSGSPTAPSRHPLNMLAAVYLRILKPQVPPQSRQKLREEWRKVNSLLLPTLTRLDIDEVTEEECVKAMDSMRGRRLEEAFKARQGKPSSFIDSKQDVKKILLKSNETLRHKLNDDGKVQMRCRAIQAASPLNLAATIQTARNVDRQLHENWNGRVNSVSWTNESLGDASVVVKMYYASGSTGAVLDEIGRSLAEGELTIAVAGDDSIIGTGEVAAGLYVENDMKMYDVSQSSEPLEENVKPCLEKLSARGGATFERWQAVAGGQFEIQDRYGKDVLSAKGSTLKPILPSGISGTTVCNNLDTMGACLDLVTHIDPNAPDLSEEVIRATRDAGWRLNLHYTTQVHTSLSSATFLKGWWVMKKDPIDEFDVHWVNLPSLVLKLGKVLSDPLTATKSQTRDPVTARYLLARGMWSSNKGIDPEYPILGPYLAQLEYVTRNRAAGRQVEMLENKEYRSFSGTDNGTFVALNRAEALSSVCYRYDTTIGEIEEVEALIRTITEIPCYISHPLFNKMAETDY